MFTVYQDSVVEKKIGEDMDRVIDSILLTFNKVDAIYLTGGFGRGEGSILLSKDGICQPLNDYDLVVITENSCDERILNSLRTRLAVECGIRQVDISTINPKKIRHLNFTMSNFDLVYASQSIYGRDLLIEEKPNWKPEEMPLKEGVVPLFLFLSALIQSYPGERNLNENQIFWSYQQLSKSILGWSTAMLIFDGLYKPSYSERSIIFKEKFSKDKELCKLVDLATNFKLRPSLNPCTLFELNELWSLTASSHIDAIKKLIPRYYNTRFKDWENLITRHRYSMNGISKAIISKIFRKHHYYDCLNMDISKLYLCFFLIEKQKEQLVNSKRFFRKISYSKHENSIFDTNQYIKELVTADKNSQIFSERGDDIFYV